MFLICDDCALNYQEIETHQKEFQTKYHSLKKYIWNGIRYPFGNKNRNRNIIRK